MTSYFGEALDYLTAQSFASLLALYWFVFIFEVPRYFLAFLVVILVPREKSQDERDGKPFPGKVSIIIAGHSEETAIERCVMGLYEQSRIPDEIIVVSDGSTDKMASKLGDLLRRGLITQAHSTDLRSGKSAGSNMAARWASGDIVINIDCDCSFDRDAILNVIKPFADPEVVAVSGNILVRNERASLVSTFQAIEYLVTISLGKQAADRLNQVSCVSGAFGAFRNDAYQAVGGLDAGGGEDLDLTLRLRRNGGRIRFVEDAICYTDVPETLNSFVKQRFRWERDAVRLRYRKHRYFLNPFSPYFSIKELVHELEFLFFNVISAAMLPFYILWMFSLYGSFAFVILLSAQLGLLVLDVATFLMAAYATPKNRSYELIPFLVGYTVFNGVYMRFVRLLAYLQEWIFRASYRDTYVPDKVHDVRG
ncbi:glycosyltransferase [Ahrensia kielensis]|uniref:Glycosyltransferase family 2 protein n=1 Tax=Ahrensia kielensis TaxID=76980 RepID=A0ABU9T6X9_9HYPH|nr:glycosyltransferase family 2 protein [Ahrensia kielensis]